MYICPNCGGAKSREVGVCRNCWKYKKHETQRRIENGEDVHCRICGVVLNKGNWAEYNKRKKLIRCKECDNAQMREYLKSTKDIRAAKRFELKVEIIQRYGGKCACCGEAEIDFLNIDHPNGDGAAHRRKVGQDIYLWLKRNKYPSGFQVLCMNCNFAKGVDGVCPHELERQQAAANA